MPLAEWWHRATHVVRPSQALVGLTTVLVVVFGYTVVQTVRQERYNVTPATCFFAADAARVLVARSLSMLQSAAAPIFAAVGGREPLDASAPLPPPSAMAAASDAVKKCHCAPQFPALGFFRVDIVDGVASRVLVDWASGAVPDESPAMAGMDTVVIRQTVERNLTRVGRAELMAASMTGTMSDTDPVRAIAVLNPKSATDGRLRAVYGIVMRPADFVVSTIAPVFEQARVFPYAMSTERMTPNTEIGAAAVLDDQWTVLYTSGPMPSFALMRADSSEKDGCFGTVPSAPTLANLMVHVIVRPSAAAQWVAKNTDVSRLVSLAVLLAGILGCSAAAAFAARREAELAGLRSDFVTSISHELRMPLAQILLFGETLSLGRARTQAERDEAADAIVRETQRLTGVVDNVLYFSRIEHHNLGVIPEPIELAAFVSDAVTDMRLLADDAGITLETAVPSGLVVQLDQRAFRRVLFDLLDNAIKYGPKGQRVTIAAREASPGRAWLSVEDQGPGIPALNEATIFQPFVRLKRDRNSGVAGSGLGLAVVHELVTRHGGRIWVEKGATGGARFVIDLPIAESVATVSLSANGHPTASSSPSSTGNGSAPRGAAPVPQTEWP
jgi:signal transduction histidine kinase